jgi:hypothetical protein
MPLPKYRNKIAQLLFQIDDKSIRTIVSEVLSVEYEYRGSHHFPNKKIEDAVDSEANLVELNAEKGNQK